MKMFRSKSEKAYDELCQHCMVMLGPPKEAVKTGTQYELNNYLLSKKEIEACSFLFQLISCLKNKNVYGCEEFINQCRQNGSDERLLLSTVSKYYQDINADKVLRAVLNISSLSDMPSSLLF